MSVTINIAAVTAVLRSDSLTTGPVVAQFEQALATATGATDAIVCSSGTAALHLAVLGIGLAPGDQVIVPTLTFLATANCARYVDAEVIFADVDADTGLLTAAGFEQALGRADPARLKAVLPVHLNGQACDMREIKAIADKRGVAEIGRAHV